MESHLSAQLSPADLELMLASIEASAKCPVCLERVRAPTAMCANGHAFCRPCRNALAACPCCRGPFSTVAPVFLDALLDVLPAHCHNSDRGCHVVSAREGLTAHELECAYRLERCRVRGCTWQQQVTELAEHVRSAHPSLSSPAEGGVARVPDFVVADDDYSARLVAADGSLFWVHVTNNFYKKQIPLFVHWLQRAPHARACVCQVTVVKEHFSFRYEQEVVAGRTAEQTLSSTLAKQFLVTPNSIFPNFISSKYDVEVRFDLRIENDERHGQREKAEEDAEDGKDEKDAEDGKVGKVEKEVKDEKDEGEKDGKGEEDGEDEKNEKDGKDLGKADGEGIKRS